MSSSRKSVQAFVQAVRQAIFHISRGNPIPADNRLLRTETVNQAVRHQEMDDTVDNRRFVVEQILRELVNEYGQEDTRGVRHQRKHRHVFNVLFRLLRQEQDKIDCPTRSYERYHTEGVQALAERFERRERELIGGKNQALIEARQQAQDILQWTEDHPGCLDFFMLVDWQRAAGIIAGHDYWAEAAHHFDRALGVLAQGPSNHVVMERQAYMAEGLGHSLMNTGDCSGALRSYQLVARLAQALGEDLLWLEAIHSLGVVHGILGNAGTAISFLEQALSYTYLDRLYPHHRRARIYRDLLVSNLHRWDLAHIEEAVRGSLAEWEAADNPQGLMVTFETWARALLNKGQVSEAKRRLRDANVFLPYAPSQIHRTSLNITRVSLAFAEGDRGAGQELAVQVRNICLEYDLHTQMDRLNRLLHTFSADDSG